MSALGGAASGAAGGAAAGGAAATTGSTTGNFLLGNLLAQPGQYVSPDQAKTSYSPGQSGPASGDFWQTLLAGGTPTGQPPAPNAMPMGGKGGAQPDPMRRLKANDMIQPPDTNNLGTMRRNYNMPDFNI